jgi:hypothetical protein
LNIPTQYLLYLRATKSALLKGVIVLCILDDVIFVLELRQAIYTVDHILLFYIPGRTLYIVGSCEADWPGFSGCVDQIEMSSAGRAWTNLQ